MHSEPVEEDVLPEDAQSDLRDATEFGDLPLWVL